MRTMMLFNRIWLEECWLGSGEMSVGTRDNIFHTCGNF